MQRQHVPNSRRVSQLLTHLRHPPGMDLGHAAFELGCQVTAGEVDVLECCREAAVACERRNRMQLPTSSRQIRQQRCRSVWVLNRSTPDLIATPRTTLDHVHGVIAAARFRRETERNRGPRDRLIARRSSR